MLDRLFTPSSLAIIGASNNSQKSGGSFLKSLIDFHYAGRLYPVNPGASEVMGLKSYPSIGEIPEAVDLVIITIPSRAVPQTLRACVEKKVKFVIVHTAGFSEIGVEGKVLEAKLSEAIRGSETRVVGPNCLGLYCPQSRISTIMPSFTSSLGSKATGSVSFIAQSGWATESVIVEGYERGLRYNKILSIGNQCDLTTADYLEYLGSDPQTKVIMAYLEEIKDARRFLSIAKQVAAEKPVIIWKSGKTDAGARAAASHTGSLAGSYPILLNAFKQAGIISVDTICELIDMAVAFSSTYLPTGNRMGVLVEAGGGAVAAADACEKFGLTVPLFSSETQSAITTFLTDLGSPTPSPKNPVDLVWPPADKMDQIITTCIELMTGECDGILWITYHSLKDEAFADNILKLQDKLKKPIIPIPALPTTQTNGFAVYTRQGIPVFTRIERAAKAVSAMARFSMNSKR